MTAWAFRMNPAVRKLAAVLPHGVRSGSTYRKWTRFIADAETWPAETTAAWQLEKLQSIVRHAFERTPGYRELYRAAGFEPGDLKTMDDFRRLPFITKQTIRDRLEDFSVALPGRHYGTTGGSTGIPFGFYHTRESYRFEKAFIHAGWRRAGWNPAMRCAVLRGGFVGTPDRIHSFDPFLRELSLSTYQLTQELLPRFLRLIRDHRIEALQAYPSALNLLCDLLQRTGLAGSISFRVILLGSENIYPWQLEKFSTCFPDAHLFGWYGHCERAILAPWCEKSRLYHVWPWYGLAEVLDGSDRDVAPGDEGELVGTSFHARATPFIRYRTMDFARRAQSPCPHCGRDCVLLESIEGREHEVIITSTGRLISMTAINMHDDIFDSLLQFQFVQERAGEVEFLVVPREKTLAPSAREKIISGLMAKLGADMKLAIREVSEIPRTKSGKFRFLDQRMDISRKTQ